MFLMEKGVKMQEIIEVQNVKITGNLPIVSLNSNMARIEKLVNRELKKKKYNSLVTMDNFTVMKKEGQFLGKVAKQISEFRIAKVKEETKDIELFQNSLKGFTKLFETKQEQIKKGLEVFEEQTRQKVLLVCKEYFEEFTLQVGLRPEFKNINLDDMTQTGYATATFKISKKGIEEVERRVNIQLTLQTKVDNRLLNLENECLKNGIEPLVEQHIKGFLFASDEDYQTQLKSLIDSEIIRNEAIKKRADEQAEKDAKEKLLNEQKALKAELEARYLGRIRTASIDQLIMINLELKSYEESATWELKKLCNGRQLELENANKIVIDETPQENHLKAIMQEKTVNVEFEPVKKQELTPFDEVIEDGKIRKFVTVTFEVVVPKNWEDKVKSTYEKRFADNIKNVENMKVEIR